MLGAHGWSVPFGIGGWDNYVNVTLRFCPLVTLKLDSSRDEIGIPEEVDDC